MSNLMVKAVLGDQQAGSAKRARRKNQTSRQRKAREAQKQKPALRAGGGDRDRTDDLKLAKLPLSQLSYAPVRYRGSGIRDQQTPDT